MVEKYEKHRLGSDIYDNAIHSRWSVPTIFVYVYIHMNIANTFEALSDTLIRESLDNKMAEVAHNERKPDDQGFKSGHDAHFANCFVQQ